MTQTSDEQAKKDQHAAFIRGIKLAAQLRRYLDLPLEYDERTGKLTVELDQGRTWLRERGF